MVCNLMVVADSDNVKGNPFDELLRELCDGKILGVVWFCEVGEELSRHLEHGGRGRLH